MKLLLIFFLLVSQTAFAGPVVIRKLHSKGFDFFAVKKEQVFFLTGSGARKEITFEEFEEGLMFQTSQIKVRPAGIPLEVNEFTKQGYIIIIKREDKVFQISGTSKIRKFNVKNYRAKLKNEKKKKFVLRETHCAFCTFNLSFNAIQLDSVSQYAGEVSWLPYWSIGDTTGLRLNLGLSPYATENDNLEEVVSLALKTQLLIKQDFGQLFIEGGGGFHYFMDYQDFSVMSTFGLGYTFLEKHWILNENIIYDSIFVQYSSIAWLVPITEVKFGISFSF